MLLSQISKISAHQKLAKIIENDIQMISKKDTHEELVQENLFILGVSMDYNAFDPRISCQLYTVGPPLIHSYNGIAVQKGKVACVIICL